MKVFLFAYNLSDDILQANVMSVPLLSANSSGSGFMEGFLRSTMISEGSHCKSKSHPPVMKVVSGHAQDSAWRNLVLMRELGSLSTLFGPIIWAE